MSNIRIAPPVLRSIDGLAVIGRSIHDLMGIRHAEGEEGGAPTVPTPPPGGTVPAAKPAAKGTPAAPADDDTPPAINATTGKPYTPAETQAYIAEIRAEAKTNRENATKAEQERDAAQSRADAILRAAGFNPDGTPYTELDPAKIAAAKSESDSERDATKRENLVLRVSPALEANADKLLDSREFNTKLSALKSDDKTGVETLVTEWVTDHPDHKQQTPAAASSGGVTHTGTAPTEGRKSKGAAIAERYAKAPASK